MSIRCKLYDCELFDVCYPDPIDLNLLRMVQLELELLWGQEDRIKTSYSLFLKIAFALKLVCPLVKDGNIY